MRTLEFISTQYVGYVEVTSTVELTDEEYELCKTMHSSEFKDFIAEKSMNKITDADINFPVDEVDCLEDLDDNT
jgi:hypothetical protein